MRLTTVWNPWISVCGWQDPEDNGLSAAHRSGSDDHGEMGAG